jgi:hypothetical protein
MISPRGTNNKANGKVLPGVAFFITNGDGLLLLNQYSTVNHRVYSMRGNYAYFRSSVRMGNG